MSHASTCEFRRNSGIPRSHRAKPTKSLSVNNVILCSSIAALPILGESAMAKRTMASWEVSEEFWKRVEPLVPGRQRAPGREYARQPGGGRKRKDDRLG